MCLNSHPLMRLMRENSLYNVRKRYQRPAGQPVRPGAKFLVYDLDSETFEVVDNQKNVSAAHGAGIKAGGTISRLGVKAIVTGHCGPNSFRVLSAAGIKIYNTDAHNVAEALAQYRAGKLNNVNAADVGGHWA